MPVAETAGLDALPPAGLRQPPGPERRESKRVTALCIAAVRETL